MSGNETNPESCAPTPPGAESGPSEKTAKQQKARESWGEFVRTLIIAVIIAVGFRTFAYEPFSIPSESMLPTLLIGDYLLVSKFSYGYSHHSLPFSPPVFQGRIPDGAPERGDVAVFKWPSDNQTDYIKRIVGLPGDTIEVRDGHLIVNGSPVERERIEDFVHPDNGLRYPQYVETLPNGESYRVIDCRFELYFNASGPVRTCETRLDNFGPVRVPEGHYFGIGDNRDGSTDSRVPPAQSGVGFIPSQNLVGRAEVIFFSASGARFWEVWNWFSAMRYGRFFDSIE